MIWINIKKLEKKIVKNEFSDKEGFQYFLAFSILGALSGSIGTSESAFTFIEMLITLLITIWGSYSIFKANSSGDGQDFFKRYFALSWVIGFRLFLYVLTLTTIYYVINQDFPNIYNSGHSDITSLILLSIIMFAYYSLLISSFKRVSMK